MILIKGDLLNVGDKLSYEDLVLEVIDKDGQRIDKIMITRIENGNE